MRDFSAAIRESIDKHIEVIYALESQTPLLQVVAENMAQALLAGHRIFWCGNGGSAADSQHLAAELVGRFLKERRALPSIALSTNTSVLTALGNDYGYEFVFSRQVEAFCTPGDVVVGISTSGSSKNVYLALKAAREKGAWTVAMTGQKRGTLAEIADATLHVSSTETPRIQEAHILCGHMLCDYVEQVICAAETVPLETGIGS